MNLNEFLTDIGFTAKYPYTDIHELNLDWCLAQIATLRVEFDNFAHVNSLKYAGEWDITKPYSAFSVVDDQGFGYMALKPVAPGTQINDTEFWLMIVDYSQLIADYEARITALETTVGDASSGLVKDVDDLQSDMTTAQGDIINAQNDITTLQGYVTTLQSQILNVTKYYDTVHDLVDALPADGSVVGTLGYYQRNDNGAGIYRIRAINPGDVISPTVDETTSYTGLIRLDGTLCAELVADNSVYNICQYGAIGDGTTDNYDVINNLIDYHVHTLGEYGVVIYIPKGKYRITHYFESCRNGNYPAPLIDLLGLTIRGDGNESIIYGYSANDTFDVFQLNCVQNINIKDIKIENRKDDANPYGANGISMTSGTSNVVIDNVVVDGLSYYDAGSYIDGGKAFTIQSGSSTYAYFENIKITNCKAVNNPYGVEISYANTLTPLKGIVISGNKLEADFCAISISSGYAGAPLDGNMVDIYDNILRANVPLQISRAFCISVHDNLMQKIATSAALTAYAQDFIMGLNKADRCQILRNRLLSDVSVHCVFKLISAYDGDPYFYTIGYNNTDVAADYGFLTYSNVTNTENTSYAYKCLLLLNSMFNVTTEYCSVLSQTGTDNKMVDYGTW